MGRLPNDSSIHVWVNIQSVPFKKMFVQFSTLLQSSLYIPKSIYTSHWSSTHFLYVTRFCNFHDKGTRYWVTPIAQPVYLSNCVLYMCLERLIKITLIKIRQRIYWIWRVLLMCTLCIWHWLLKRIIYIAAYSARTIHDAGYYYFFKDEQTRQH